MQAGAPIRPIDGQAMPAILALNNAHAAELSWLDPQRLRRLLDEAFFARESGNAAAFLIAFDETADYDSPNYLWFRERCPRFVYIDRIAVAPAARGQGLARRLYEGLFQAALLAGQSLVTCEVNADPPNPASDAFHSAMGFVQVGRAEIHGGTKTVRYFAKTVT